MYSRDYLDDYDPSSTYLDACTTIGVERKEEPSRAERRKNEWKYAKRRKKIVTLDATMKRPLHYYSKNSPSTQAYRDDTPSYKDRREIQKVKNQIKELFDEE